MTLNDSSTATDVIPNAVVTINNTIGSLRASTQTTAVILAIGSLETALKMLNLNEALSRVPTSVVTGAGTTASKAG